MRTYLKTLTRMFTKHFTRLLSIILMVLVAVGFVSGLGSTSGRIYYSMDDLYVANNVSDFVLKNTGGSFSEETIEALERKYGEENVNVGSSFDAYIEVDGEDEPQLTRLYFLDGLNDGSEVTVNVSDEAESWGAKTEYISAYFESPDNFILGYEGNQVIELDFLDILDQQMQLQFQNEESGDGESDEGMTTEEWEALYDLFSFALGDSRYAKVEIVGEVEYPLMFAMDTEPSYLNPEDMEIPSTVNGVNELIGLDNVLFLPSDTIPDALSSYLADMDIYIADPARSFSTLDNSYQKYVNAELETIESLAAANGDEFRAITLFDNYSFVSLDGYTEVVEEIGYLMMVLFLLVTILVVLSTMTRLVEEERGEIGCLRTLGYSSFRINFKYLLYAAIGTLIGAVGAYFVGMGLSYLIYVVFEYTFRMPPMSSHLSVGFFFITFAVIFVATLVSTLIAGYRMTREEPANLLRPKEVKGGKKVFLEKIPFIWNRLSFKYKSTVRNVLRYLSRFVMTVVAVTISTAIVMTGLALLDLCLGGPIESASVTVMAVVVVIFAALLTAIVIYTLTDINVSERNRELATLMVLGYQNGEVAGYIYREIYIDVAIGIIIGLPLSLPFMLLLFNIMGVGTILAVSWYMWIIGIAVVVAFTAVVTLMLRPKITRIKMNESLKAVE